MSISTLIIGESGTGKTCSARNLNPKKTLLIQPVRKPLPFPAKDWREGKGGNIYVCDDADKVILAMHKAPHEIIVIDDFQYFLLSPYMSRRNEKSYEKFSAIAGIGYDIAKAASSLDENKRVYILGHSATDDFGNIRVKTIGKMLDSVIVLEGLFTTVLRTRVDPANGGYFFRTQNDGTDTVKSPLGMFEYPEIENDIASVDRIICDYYNINSNNIEES